MRKMSIRRSISAISKLALICVLVLVSSCEDLTDSLNPRDNIVDTWKCTEKDSSNGTDSFLIEIEADNVNVSGIKIYNFNHLGDNIFVKATVSGSSITIPEQDADGYTIKGTGSIKAGNEEISLNYSVDDGAEKINYTAVCTKP